MPEQQEQEPNPCAAVGPCRPDETLNGGARCGRAYGHAGQHHDMTRDTLWDHVTGEECWARTAEDGVIVRCTRPDGHEGNHRTFSSAWTDDDTIRLERDIENEQQITRLRATLKEHLAKSGDSLLAALSTIAILKRNDVYDVEFAECENYIEQAVKHAGLYTVSAQAMVEVLK